MTLRLIHQLCRIPRHMILMGNTVESSRGACLEFLLCVWTRVKGLLQLLPSSGWQFIWMVKYWSGQPPTDHKSELRAVGKLMSLGPFIHSCKQCIVACSEEFWWRKMCLLCRMVVGDLGSHSYGRGRVHSSCPHPVWEFQSDPFWGSQPVGNVKILSPLGCGQWYTLFIGICFWTSRLFCYSRMPAAIFISEIGCGATVVSLGHICPPSSC